MDREKLENIMKIELKEEWKLDLITSPSWKGKSWEGIALEKSKTIVLHYNKNMNCFHGLLHELAHAIEIEKRPNKKGDSHDVFYALTLTQLISKYTVMNQRF